MAFYVFSKCLTGEFTMLLAALRHNGFYLLHSQPQPQLLDHPVHQPNNPLPRTHLPPISQNLKREHDFAVIGLGFEAAEALHPFPEVKHAVLIPINDVEQAVVELVLGAEQRHVLLLVYYAGLWGCCTRRGACFLKGG
jgi:hypothetical protein